MATLQGQEIKDTYQSLLKTDGNTTISSSLQAITDGQGNATALSLSTEQVFVSSSLIIGTADNILYYTFYDPSYVITLPWSYIYLEMGNASNFIDFTTISSQTANSVTLPGDVSSVTIAPIIYFYGQGTTGNGDLIDLPSYPGLYPYYYDGLQVTSITYNAGTNQSTVTFASNFLSEYPNGYESIPTASANLYSLNNGLGTQSPGLISHAEGYLSTAVGIGSHAEGYYTSAVGEGSHAEGSITTAIGNYSHTEGATTVTIGNSSHAEGQQTTAIGANSHAEGASTTAIGNGSHAEGYYTTAIGNYSHTEGTLTLAIGTNSHAEGSQTTSLQGGHAEGSGTTAIGESSHAEGYFTTSIGNYSHAEGDQTTAIGNYSHTEGKYGLTTEDISHAEGYGTEARGYGSHVEGLYGVVYGIHSHGEGWSPYIASSAEAAHGEGYGAYVSASISHAEGFRTTTKVYGSHAEGAYTISSGSLTDIGTGIPQHAEGRYNVPDATSLLIVGNGTADNARANAFTVTTWGTNNVSSSLVTPFISQSLNYANDTAAASGGVPLGGFYHNSGALRIRLV